MDVSLCMRNLGEVSQMCGLLETRVDELLEFTAELAMLLISQAGTNTEMLAFK